MSVRNLAEQYASANAEQGPVCIIGAGMAGLALAHGLVSKGIRVILLESGGTAPDPAIEGLNDVDNANGRWTGARRSRCRGIGGTSRLWGGRTIPIAELDAKPRHHLKSEGWPFCIEELEEYTPQVEKTLLLDHSSYEADLFVDSPTDPDFRVRWAKWPAFKNLNLAARFHRQVIASPLVTLWTNATVTGFAFDPENACLTQVTAEHQSGRKITVAAQRFVLATGTVETTRLLLWMQRQAGQGLLISKSLGRHFQDHLNLKTAKILRHRTAESNLLLGYRFVNAIRRSLHLELSPQTQAECGVGSAFAYVSMDLDGSALGSVKKLARTLQQGRVDLAEFLALSGQGALVLQSLIWRYMHKRLFVPTSVDFHIEICAEQAPHWDNAITLSDQTDIFGIPLARVNWEPKDADDDTLRISVERLSKFWIRSGWDRVGELAWLPSVTQPMGRLIDSCVDYYHPSGTTPMGRDMSTSVVSADLTCHGVGNLSVLSASVFPRAGSANPTFTIMRMAYRLADHLTYELDRNKNLYNRSM